MTMRTLVGKTVQGQRIESPTNAKYSELCQEKGNNEIRAIMTSYTEAMKEAGKIFVK